MSIFRLASLVLAMALVAACGNGNGGACYGVMDCELDPPCMAADAPCLTSACHAPPYNTTCVSGHIVDDRGCPKICQAVVACTEGTCYFGKSDADGFFTVSISATDHPDLSLYFPVPMEGVKHHSPFCHYTELCDDNVRVCAEYVLYDAPTSGEAVPESTGPTDPNPLPAEVRVTASDGGALILHAGDEVDLPLFSEPWVAFERFPLGEHVPCFIDPANPPIALYTVTPMDTMVIEPATHLDPVFRFASLDLPNETGLAAGTALDVYVLGGVHPLDYGLYEGEWAPMADAEVSSDGTRIQTVAGQGMGYLTWIGIYAP